MPLRLLAKNTRRVGRRKEALAARFLRRQGLSLIQANYCCKVGELDLVMLEPPRQLVFIEVRFRSSNSYGGAMASIGAEKQRKIRRTAAAFLQHHSRYRQLYCRFDVVAISGGDVGRGDSIDWIKNAFY